MNGDSALPVVIVAGLEPGRLAVVGAAATAAAGELALGVVRSGMAAPDLDVALLALADEEVVVCASEPCLCCAQRLDLVRVVGKLAARGNRPDLLVVEADADTDLALMAQTMLRDPDLRRHTELQGIVVVVDAVGLALGLDMHGILNLPDSWCDQLAMADVVVLRNIDRLNPSAQERLLWALGGLAPRSATVAGSRRHQGRAVLDVDGFGTSRLGSRVIAPRAHRALPADSEPRTVVIEIEGWLEVHRLSSWIDDLHAQLGADLLRLDGVLAIDGERRRWVARGARTTLDLQDGATWDHDEVPRSSLALVGRRIEAGALGDTLVDCLAS